MASTFATVIQKYAFGFQSEVNGNVGILSDGRIVYPAGSNIVVYKRPSDSSDSGNTQVFVQRDVKDVGDGITAMAAPIASASAGRSETRVAIAEKGEPPRVLIYEIPPALPTAHRGKKMRQLVGAGIESKEFVCIAFDATQKCLLSLSGAPDYVLSYWQIDKPSAPLAQIPVTALKGETATQCSFNPMKIDVVCVTGNGIVKLFRCMKEGSLRPTGPNKPGGAAKTEPREANYLCHCWLNEDQLLLGGESGKLTLINNNDIASMCLPCSPAQKGDNIKILSIVRFSKGFVIGCEGGKVIIYEKEDDPTDTEGLLYTELRVLEVPAPAKDISHMALGGATGETDLIVTSSYNQMYILNEFSSYVMKDDTWHFEFVSHKFHSEAVLGMDVCIRKPLIVTCGTDRSVRVWNYLTMNCDLCLFFNEAAYSVALHPSGTMVLVGFSDKLRLMNVLYDNLTPVREFAICRGCLECRFSNGGQYFAAARDNNHIQVYNTYTFECFAVLSGHNGKVRSIFWTDDDSRIITTGHDGAVYEWDYTVDHQRKDIHNKKICSYTSLVVTHDGHYIYAVGSDKKFKEMTFDGSEAREMDTGGLTYTQVALSRQNRMLFVGTDKGTIRTLKYPNPTGEYMEFNFHCAPVSRMRISYDEKFLFTAGADGCLVISEVREGGRERDLATRDIQIDYAEEITITKDTLKEKDDAYSALQAEILSQQQNWEYNINTLKNEKKASEEALVAKWQILNDELREANYNLRLEKDHQLQHYEEQLNLYRENFRRELEKVKRENGDMTLAAHTKYEQLEQAMVRQAEEFAHERERHYKELQEAQLDMHERHKKALTEERDKLEKKDAKIDQMTREYNETKRQIEEDADAEMQERILFYRGQIDERDNKILKLKGLVGVMRKEFTQLNKAIDVELTNTKKAEEKAEQYRIEGENAAKQMQDLAKEIDERNDTIKDKEDRIHELKKKNQELEKFKFVLEYKNKELNKQLEPRDEQINEQIKQINQMDSELEKYYKNNITLKLETDNFKLKVSALEKEIVAMRSKLTDAQAVTKRFRKDLHECVQFIQDPKRLKEMVKNLYQKHVTMQAQDAGIDVDIQRENNRQREYLERSVASLKRKVTKDQALHRADSSRIMQENVALIKEINELRREIKQLRSSNRNKASLSRGDRRGMARGSLLAQRMYVTEEVMPLDASERERDDQMLPDLGLPPGVPLGYGSGSGDGEFYSTGPLAASASAQVVAPSPPPGRPDSSASNGVRRISERPVERPPSSGSGRVERPPSAARSGDDGGEGSPS